MQKRTSNMASLSLWVGVLLLLAVGLSGFSQLSVNLWSRAFLKHATQAKYTNLSPAPTVHRMALTWLAQAALKDNDPEQALKTLSPDLRANNPFAQRIAGQSYLLQGEYELAIQAWVQAGDFVSLTNFAKSIEIDHPEIALSAYQGAQTIDPQLGTRPLVTFLRKIPDQSATAEAVLIQSINAYPKAREFTTWQRMLAGAFTERGQWWEAERIYNDLLIDNPNDYYTWINLAWLQFENLGNLDKAISNINKAISISPNNGFAYFTMGRLMAAENRYDEADQWFQQAVDRNPVESNWWHTRVEASISAGKKQQALEINQIALGYIPDDTRLYLQQARIHQSLDNRQSALSAISKAVNIGKLSTWQWLEVGQIYEWAGEMQKAINAYQKVLNSMPENILAKNRLELIESSVNK